MAKTKDALNLEIERVDDPLSIWDYREKWLELLDRTQERNPFLTPHWVFLSYDYFGVKEFFDFYILRHNGNVVGFLPLSIDSEKNCVTTVNADLKRAITDILAEPYIKEHIFQLLLERFDKIHLPRIIENSSTLWAMEKTAQNAYFEKEHTDTINKIDLAEDFDRMLYREKGKLKGKGIKLIKKLEREVHAEIGVFTNKKDIAFALDEVLSLQDDNIFSIGEVAFLRDITTVFSKSGWARVYVLKADDWPVAGGVVFSYENSSFLYVLTTRKETLELKVADYLFLEILKNEGKMGIKSFYFFNDGFNPLVSTKKLKIKKAILSKNGVN